MNLQDNVIVITGAGSGLGKAMAFAFAKWQARVVVSGRNKEDVESLAQEINGFAVAADVTKEKEVWELAAKTVEKFGRIDVWVNNAGIWMPHAPIEKMDWKRVHDLMEVNLFGTIYGSKAALLQMSPVREKSLQATEVAPKGAAFSNGVKKQGFGAIINILSTSALEGRPNSSGYCASKFAASGFTKSLRAETKDANIKVIAVYPGGMKTNLFDEDKPADYDQHLDPKEVAEKIVSNLEQESPEEELIIKRQLAR